jgi:hypothetical protein
MAVLAGLLALLTAILPRSHVLMPALVAISVATILAALVVSVPDAVLFLLLILGGILATLNVPNVVTILVYAAAILLLLAYGPLGTSRVAMFLPSSSRFHRRAHAAQPSVDPPLRVD